MYMKEEKETIIEEKDTVLVVDDNPTNLRVLIEYLEDFGFETMVAPSGERALQQLERAIPDLILLDVMMIPGIDGFETCKRIKENSRLSNIPIIFMTALSETENKVKGFDLGAVDYITKPFKQEEVLVRIRTHLTIQRQKKALAELNSQLRVTNDKLAESNVQLSETNAKLTEAIATRDKFFSFIADDLMGTISPLLSLSKNMVKNVETIYNKRVKKVAQNIQKTASNTQRIMENMLGWVLVQKGMMEYNPEIIYFHGIVRDTIKSFEYQFVKKHIKISHSINPATFIFADKQMMLRILDNLVSNALKYTNPEGSVSIDSKDLGEYEEISVSDTGIGINGEYIKQLFKVTSKLRSEGTEGESGTGLGLILCKELVEKNGGKIWIESEEGKGTIIRFSIPKGRRKGVLSSL